MRLPTRSSSATSSSSNPTGGRQREGLPRRIGGAETSEEWLGVPPRLAQAIRRSQEQRQEFYELMSAKFNKPRYCQGENCSGYVYQWRPEVPHDWDTDGFEPKPCSCPSGQVFAEEQRRAELEQRKKEKEQAFRVRLANSNLPTRYIGFTFESYRQTTNGGEAWLNQVEEWLGTWPECQTGLIFAGDLGRGKTGLAIGIACQLAQQYPKLSLYFANVADLISQFWGAWGRRDGSEQALIDRLKQAELLILDDLGAGHKFVAAEGEERTPVRYLYEILDHRYSYARPTIITTNAKSLKGLSDILGMRTMSRVTDFCKFLRVTGESLRQGL